MSAEDLGMRELGQVRSQRLDELLTTLRLLHDSSSNPKIGIPALDKLLANHTTRFDPTNLSAIPAPPIIEINSPVPKSGKTEFLYWVIANLVLGSDGLGVAQGSKTDRGDVDMDDGMRTTSNHGEDPGALAEATRTIQDETTTGHTDATASQSTDQTDQPSNNNSAPRTNLPKGGSHTGSTAIALLSTTPVNISRLSQILLQHLLTKSPDLSLRATEPILLTALSHIHIHTPTSLSSLIATISSLPSYFLSPSNKSKQTRLGAIVINTPSSYVWEDKFASTSASSTSHHQTKFPALATVLKRVSMHLQTPILYTTHQLSTPTSLHNTSIPPTLPSPFSSFPSLRLTISAPKIQGFGKDTDAETALRQSNARNTAVSKQGFRVEVIGSDSRDAGFEVRIDGSGVVVV